MATKPRGSTMSRSKVNKGHPGDDATRPARAHRGDTFEAREQKRRLPKTHPTRNAKSRAASRKDK